MAQPKMTTIGGQGGRPAISFRRGALHRQLGVPEGEKIPPEKMAAARAGKFGPVAKRRAAFAQGMLAAGRRTAARNK
jgi:hypothetical protein